MAVDTADTAYTLFVILVHDIQAIFIHGKQQLSRIE
jgi:hypothetical protein